MNRDSRFAAACPLDPSVLDRPIPRRSLPLLLEVGVDEQVARALAYECSFRRVFDVAARVRSARARNPAGLARRLLETGGLVPRALIGEAEERILNELAAEAEECSRFSSAASKPRTERLPGESVDDWLRRVLDRARHREARERSDTPQQDQRSGR